MRRAGYEPHELITPGEALKILTWVSASGLYAGAKRTNELTRFPAGTQTLFSRQECEALRDSIIDKAKPSRRLFVKRTRRDRQVITELT